MEQIIPLFLAEDEENIFLMARQRVFSDLNDFLDCYNDLELVRRFCFSGASIYQFIELIANYFKFYRTSYAASTHFQVCVALQFFPSGTFQTTCGDGINLTQSSASWYIRDVSPCLQAYTINLLVSPLV